MKNIGLTGQSTRKTYQRTLPANSTKDYYFIHRDTGSTEPIIVEYGFIDDTPQNVAFLDDNYKELAEAVIKSILEYKNIPYTAPSTTTASTYTVQKGDSLYAIAKKYNTTVEELKQLNNLTTNNLSIGQVLKLPLAENTYTVKPGDTLYRIATQNNTTVAKIKELNQLTSDILSIGQTLILPSTEIITVPSTKNYTVQKGDTLYSIAKKNNTTVQQLKQLNNLNTNTLTIGQIIAIPSTQTTEIPTSTITYTVKPGDTLYSIAREYNTTINNIKDLNNLTTNNLAIDQKLLIPT